MKLVPEGELEYGRVRSEGKLLEIIPSIEDGSGQPMILPGAVWPVDNWILGFEDYHYLSSPIQFFNNMRTMIPGTRSAANHRMTFLVRILEAGAQPSPASTIDADAVKELVQAIRIAPDVYSAS